MHFLDDHGRGFTKHVIRQSRHARGGVAFEVVDAGGKFFI
jgi:hypothetical protein